ncbi:MAG: enolase C-terminal domain-like protein [Proteiniphilum sp.]|nr:enolase C-terminal domain-like protein [Proteiniphilum sp.]
MNRRNFLGYAAYTGLAAMLPGTISGSATNFTSDQNNELDYHIIDNLRFTSVKLSYPRLVGKNAQLGIHGHGPTVTLCTLSTKQGASGIGMLRGSEEKAEEIFNQIKGKKVSEVFSVDSGVTDLSQVFDIPLHDLTGVILKKPVYQLLGQESPIITKCYSGMVYMDDVDIKDNRKAFDKILEECFYDYNRGYRQFKLKIGRGFKWMPAEEGLKRDVEITHMVNRYFPDVDILVDANDGYTVKNFIRYLEQLEDISIWWIEEPFRETVDDFTVLRKWLNDNRKRNTLLADGEARPDLNLALEMGKKQVLDVYLEDIMGYGFTNWRKLMPRLIENGLQASPHNWGDYLKTIYTGHLAGGIGNVVTNEGVTCFSSDIDFGFNRVENGVFIPSSSPGFGVTLLK